MRDALSLSPARALILVAVFFAVGGFTALFALLACQYILRFHGGIDQPAKHGIATQTSLRLGGVFIITYWLAELLILTEIAGQGLNLDLTRVSLAYCAGLFALGLYSDLKGDVSPTFRFVTMFILACLALLLRPTLLLAPVGVAWIDPWLLEPERAAFVFTALALTFLPNAFNTADGANGLVSGISMIVLLALTPFMNFPLDLVHLIIASLGLFLVLNLFTGRFFLGDSGAYLCGAVVGFALIYVSNRHQVPVWYLVALIFYPVFDLIFAMCRRLILLRSPLNPDDEHLHNLLFALLSPRVRSPRFANTVTGVSLAVFFSGVPGYLFSTESEPRNWGLVLLFQSLTYLVLWWILFRQHLKDRQSKQAESA
jgi:UDP-GlcNAc:undecaprenyl-phosphate GlcNAc-1-phosphate transferase